MVLKFPLPPWFIRVGAATRRSCILVAGDRKWEYGRKAFQVTRAQKARAEARAPDVHRFRQSCESTRVDCLGFSVQKSGADCYAGLLHPGSCGGDWYISFAFGSSEFRKPSMQPWLALGLARWAGPRG